MDSLNRNTQTRSNGLNGVVVTAVEYNGRGQMIRETVPRYSNAPEYDTDLFYDALGRQVLKQAPQQTSLDTNPGLLNTRYNHNGLSTQIVVGNQISTCSPGMAGEALGTNLCVSRTYATNGWLLSTSDAHQESTQFFYDGQGNPTTIIDPNGNQTTAIYNDLGHRNQLNDPNMGIWTYTYNGLGEVMNQVDANGQIMTFDYDDLGRMIRRVGTPAAGTNKQRLVDEWEYDSAPNGVGLISRTERFSDTNTLPDAATTYNYDAFSRPSGTDVQLANNMPRTTNLMVMSMEYDSYFARMTSMTWHADGTGDGANTLPIVRQYNKYNVDGYLIEQGDSGNYQGGAGYNVPNLSAWRQIIKMTPIGQVEAMEYANSLETVNRYSKATWQQHETAVDGRNLGDAPLLNQFYQYDTFGNLAQQTRHSLMRVNGQDITTMDHESFTYDRLHRLLSSEREFDPLTSNAGLERIDYSYDALGNITQKSDYANNGTYQYGTANNGSNNSNCAAGPNAVTNVGSTNYSYDCNGNMTAGTVPNINTNPGNITQNLNFDVHNKPVMIERGGNISEFWYDADQQRHTQNNSADGITHYLGKAYERKGNVHKLYLDDYAVYTVDYNNDSNTEISYFHKDRLGSISAISTELGQPQAGTERGYDPFGKPREATWEDSDGGDDASILAGDLNGFDTTTKGFTGHEHLNNVALIHMNGRVYDYNLGRFLSVDPVIQFLSNSQSLNPYSYIMNNPLSGTDPTGFTTCSVDDPSSCISAAGNLEAGESVSVRQSRNGSRTTSEVGTITANENGT